MKKVMDLRNWPQSVPQPSMDDVLRRKKEKREKRINETKSKIKQIRNKK